MTDHHIRFRWEQDGAGGDHGTATYFPGTVDECTVAMPTFKEAHALQQSIERQMQQTRRDARCGLLAEISRIKP